MKNLVLYRQDERGFMPLFSCSPEDPMAGLRVAQKSVDALRDAESRGVPAPRLRAVIEERKANEAGQQTDAKFVEVNPQTLAPLDAKRKAANSLAELDA